MGIIQQQGQGGKRARRHHVKGAVRQVFHPGIADFDLKAHAIRGGLQEGTLLGGGIMQRDLQFWPKGRQHQARKTGARSQVS